MSSVAGNLGRPIPASAVERLLRNFDRFLASVRSALNATQGSEDRARWMRAEQLLTRDFVALQAAVKQVATGNLQPLVEHAGRLRFLARRMDGYRLDFAGALFESQLRSERRLLVLVAWQIYATAQGSQATGL